MTETEISRYWLEKSKTYATLADNRRRRESQGGHPQITANSRGAS